MRIDLKKLNHRGSLSNPKGRFESIQYEANFEDLEPEIEQEILKTTTTKEIAKKILTKNNSPDIPFSVSINPYRGCEHGCIYCYARPSHSYMNLSAGLDFETQLFYKENAAELLEQEFSKKNYKVQPIAFGANTDPYQPIERKFQITKSLLEICLKWKHPLSIITKSNLILRDIEILSELAKLNLVKVFISITTLNTKLAKIMEPRAASPMQRLNTISKLVNSQIPTGVMTAPIIPFLNDQEIESILEESSKAGALNAAYVFLRLPFELKELFEEWLNKHFPLKAKHILNLIKSSRGGKLYNSDFSQRMSGEGAYAKLIASRHKAAKIRFQVNKNMPEYNLNLFEKKFNEHGQYNLF